MTVSLDIAIYSHRYSPWQVRAAESVARHTRESYRLIQITQPGSAHINLNRVLEASSAPFLVILDEDSALTDHSWVQAFEDSMADPSIGIVGAFQARHPFEKPQQPNIEEVAWVPGYFMGLARHRFPELRFDEAIPGLNGMTDLDYCLQVRQKGFRIVRDNRIIVHHPQRDEDDVRAVEQRPTTKQQDVWYPMQLRHMRLKWGDELFINFLQGDYSGIEAISRRDLVR